MANIQGCSYQNPWHRPFPRRYTEKGELEIFLPSMGSYDLQIEIDLKTMSIIFEGAVDLKSTLEYGSEFPPREYCTNSRECGW